MVPLVTIYSTICCKVIPEVTSAGFGLPQHILHVLNVIIILTSGTPQLIYFISMHSILLVLEIIHTVVAFLLWLIYDVYMVVHQALRHSDTMINLCSGPFM